MAKKKGTFRTTISVPLDLKERMDAVDENVNWSAIACQAYEQFLGELAQKKVRKDMTDVVQRLRASKLRGQKDLFAKGEEFGRTWAEELAEATELERLERCRASSGTDWWIMFDSNPARSVYCPAYRLFWELHPEHDGDRSIAEEFWSEALGEEDAHLKDDDSFLQGFAEGALDLWEDVQGEI